MIPNACHKWICSLLLALTISTNTGCATRAPKPVELESNDIELASKFLDALLRPGKTHYRVIADAYVQAGQRHIPAETFNQELESRISLLRNALPNPVEVSIRSSDRPKPTGSGPLVFNYDKSNGYLKKIGTHYGPASNAILRICIIHWPDGTTLVNADSRCFGDERGNFFHLNQHDNRFRFVSASWPLY